jgi:serine/threonine-protein kinase
VEQIGRYTLSRKVGEDAVSEVWLARDGDKRVVLKRVRAPDDGFEAFFREEMERVSKLSHPNIVPVPGFGVEGGVCWWAAGYAGGHTLSALIEAVQADGGPIALLIAAECAKALAHAHSQKVFHLGLSPAKVHLSTKGEVRIADFGIAKIAQRLPREAGALVRGEPAYMSPEQVDGNPLDLDGRSDVFSLGILLFELLTGAPVFTGTPSEILHAVANFQFPDGRVESLPAELKSLLKRALALHKEQRVQDVVLMAEKLSATLGKGGAEAARASLVAILDKMRPEKPDEVTPPPEPRAPLTELRPVQPPAAPARPGRTAMIWTGIAILVALGAAVAAAVSHLR